MQKDNLFEKVALLKERFKHFFQHRKKISALENYAQAETVSYHQELKLLKLCIGNRFLSQKGADFLDELLEEHHVNHLDWAHRTKWLKKKIADGRKKTTLAQQTFFDLDSSIVPVHIPFELLNNMDIQHSMRP